MIFLARMLLFLVFSSCTIKHSFVTPTYEELEKNKLKKIVHYLKPFKSEKSIKNLYYQISRAYISHHKEYLLITAKRATKLENIKKLVGDQAAFELLNGVPKLEIVRYAKEINADLIVIGSHGRGGVQRLLGSTANGTLHRAPCDVLVIRASK